MYNGVCEEAMNFYKECFNGEIVNMGRYGDSPMEVPEPHKTKIVHVEFRFWEVHPMPLDNMDIAESSEKSERSRIHLSLEFEDSFKMEQTFEKLKQDGQVTVELKEQFWGDNFGMLTDKFGIKWMFNCPKTVSDKEN